jgi:hypothetical protein
MTKAIRVLLAAGVLAGLTGAARSEEPASLIQGLAGSRARGMEVQAGALVLRTGQVGSAFGTVQLPGGKRQVAWFVVIQHRYGPDSTTDTSEETSADGKVGTSRQTIGIDGRTLNVGYVVRLDEKKKKVVAEQLILNGKEVAASKGRVILVDLTVAPPKWRQKKLDLPAEVPEATKKEDAERFARKVLEHLARQDKEIETLLERRK